MLRAGFLEVDRLRETLYSPIMSHFGESLRGCVTIRAFKDSARFTAKSHNLMDKKETAVISQELFRLWLDVRMQCGVATPLIAFSSLLAILGKTRASSISVAAAGLGIQYAGRITDELISVTENFTWVCSTHRQYCFAATLFHGPSCPLFTPFFCFSGRRPVRWHRKGLRVHRFATRGIDHA